MVHNTNIFISRRGSRTFLTRIMQKAINIKGHNSIFIYGAKGDGKSTYAMLCLYSIFRDWDKVLEHMLFMRKQINDILKSKVDPNTLEISDRIPCMCWDDATYENLRTKKYDPYMDKFVRLYTVIRSVLSNFIWTAPNFTLVPSKIQSLDWLLVRVVRADVDYSIAYFYKYNQAPYKSVYLSPLNIADRQIKERFYFNWIPKDVRAKYEKIRDRYSVQGIFDVEEALEYSNKNEALQKERVDLMYKQYKKANSEDGYKKENFKFIKKAKKPKWMEKN